MPIKTELENEAEQARLVLEILNDESALHTNILRGNVKMSRAIALHIAGATDYDELQAEVERLRKDNGELETEFAKAERMLPVITRLFEFLSQVAETQQPLMTQVCAIESEQELPIISLWAGIGNVTPFDSLQIKNQKIEQLQAQLARYERMMKEATRIEFGNAKGDSKIFKSKSVEGKYLLIGEKHDIINNAYDSYLEAFAELEKIKNSNVDASE